MAKVPFTKLYTKEDLGKVKTFTWNEQEIEVKQYLSLQEKMNVANEMIAEITEKTEYLNPLIINAIFELAVVFNYSNINFTEKQKADLIKTYDILKEVNIISSIIHSIPEAEFQELKTLSFAFLKNIMDYRNSAYAIINNFVDNANAQSLDLDQIVQTVKNNPEILELSRNFNQMEYNPLISSEEEGTKEDNNNVIKLNNN